MYLHNPETDEVYDIHTKNGFVFVCIHDRHPVSAKNLSELLQRLRTSYNLYLTTKGA